MKKTGIFKIISFLICVIFTFTALAESAERAFRVPRNQAAASTLAPKLTLQQDEKLLNEAVDLWLGMITSRAT